MWRTLIEHDPESDAGGVVTTLAGGVAWNPDSADGTGIDARFFCPTACSGQRRQHLCGGLREQHDPKRIPGLAITSSGPNFGFSGGQFGFNLTGPAGQRVILEASTDLVSWLPIWTNTFAGSLHFSDPQSGAASRGFYRAHTP